MRFVGIDPGLDGAIACIDEDLSILLCEDLPTLTRTVGKKHTRILNVALLALKIAELEECCGIGEPPTVSFACEISQPMRRTSAGRTQGVSSTFSTGRTFGMIEGVFATLSIAVVWLKPRAWKQQFGLNGSDKSDSITKAVQLMPHSARNLTRKKDHGRAEALLLAYFVLNIHRKQECSFTK